MVIFALVALGPGCGGTSSPASPETTPTKLSVLVVPTLLGVGETGQATASLSGTAVWSSTNPPVATIGVDGVVHAIAAGSVDINGALQQQSATRTVRVLSGDEVTMKWAVSAGGGVALDGSVVWTMSVGQVLSLTPRAVFDKTDISSTIYDVLPATRETWATSDPSIVAITAPGQVTAIARGVSYVTATWLGKTGTVKITVK